MIDWEHWIFELLAILNFVVVLAFITHILLRQKNYAVAIAWITVLLFMPFLGVVLYLLFGQIFISKHYQHRIHTANTLLNDFIQSAQISFASDQASQNINEKWRTLADMAEKQTGFGIQSGHQAILLTDAEQMFDALIADIHAAKKSILLEFYIIHPEGRVFEVLDALKSAHARGVSCVILADSVGSMAFFASDACQGLRMAGVRVQELFPVGIFKSIFTRADVRNHRKLVCIDEHIGYIGSFNLADPQCFKQDCGIGTWIDVMLRITHHQDLSVVKAMGFVIATDMSAEQDGNLFLLKKLINNYRQKIIQRKSKKYVKPQHHINKNYPAVENVQLQLLPSSPQLSGHLLYETIINALYYAKQQIIITTPYFVPDESLMLALTSAKRRGVDVCIIMPKLSDSKLVQYASQAYFESLLKVGITLALYEGGLLHSKIISIDQQYALFGTVNMDMRSFYLNMEVTLAIYANSKRENLSMIDEIDALQQDYLTACTILNLDDWQSRPVYLRVLDGVVRLMSPLL